MDCKLRKFIDTIRLEYMLLGIKYAEVDKLLQDLEMKVAIEQINSNQIINTTSGE